MDKDNQDKEILEYFLALKSHYAEQRQPLESQWEQALAAYLVTDKIDKTYNGRSNIRIPVMHWKVNGIVARIMRIMFNSQPFARIEKSLSEPLKDDYIDLWNNYIFSYQLPEISFKNNYRLFCLNKTIYGTAVAKITQENETKEFSFFDGEEPEEVTVKDNTYFRPILLTEFYSDINCPDINDSQACIHSTTVSIESLLKNKKRIETTEEEVLNPEDGSIISTKIVSKEVGFYENLNLLTYSGNRQKLTDEQIEYTQYLGLSQKQTGIFQRSLEETNKSGFVKISEYYGLYDLNNDGVPEEVLVTIANDMVVIRKQPTPFRHKKYVRPFIVGRYKEISNYLYGFSNVILGTQLYQELNASRAQATDAKTASVFPMWYMDVSKNVVWDKRWTPNGIIKGQGQEGIKPIINPNLGNISINDSVLIQRDLDQLWSLSPVQEGTSDNRFIPQTARGTQAVISQNDMPLNEIIDYSIENEIKPFLEILFERNVVFKTAENLLTTVGQGKLQKSLMNQNLSMKDLIFKPIIKILGSAELSNEVAMQSGWVAFGNMASQNPNLSNRINWTMYGEKLLRSFGIKDDSEGVFIDEEIVQQSMQDQQMRQAQEAERQIEESMMMRDSQMAAENMQYQAQKTIDTESEIVKMAAKQRIEGGNGS